VYEHLDSSGRNAVLLAQEESRRLGHNFVGTEQILLGLIADRLGVAARVLAGCGVNLKNARVEVEKIIGCGSGFVAVEIPFTPRAKLVLEKSWEQSKQLGHKYVGTAHILLALCADSEGVGARVLELMGVSRAYVKERVIELLPGAAMEDLQLEGRRARKLFHADYDILGVVAQIAGLECALSDLRYLIKGSQEDKDEALPAVLVNLENSLKQLSKALEPDRLSELRALITDLRKDIHY